MRPRLAELVEALFRAVPCGVGARGFAARSTRPSSATSCARAPAGACGTGYGWPEDLERTEGHGCLPGADPAHVSERAIERGPRRSSARSGRATTTSRSRSSVPERHPRREARARARHRGAGAGLRDAPLRLARLRPPGGHRLSAQLRRRDAALRHHGPRPRARVRALPLARGPGVLRRDDGRGEHGLREPAGDHAPRAGGHDGGVREGCARPGALGDLRRLPQHREARASIGSTASGVDLVVHRKGATRAFGPGMPDVPDAYREIGQPVIIGGSMETGSALLVGTAARDGRDLRLDRARRGSDDVAASGQGGASGARSSCRTWRRAASSCGPPRSPASPRRPASPTRISTPSSTCSTALDISRRVASLAPIGNIKG